MDRLSVREVRALVFLEERGPASLLEVSRALGIPPSTAHGMLTKLVALGLVAKTPGKQYEITDEGRETIAEVKQLLVSVRG